MSKRALPLLFVTLALAAPASAQTYLTPFAGVAFSGDTDDSKLTFGGDLTFAGGGPLGFSVDFGYTKDFFGSAPPVGDNNVTTLMGNLVLITPGKLRLYGSSGVGLLKTRVKDVDGFFDVGSTDFGFNVGGGLYIVGDGPIGARGDIRYFRRLSDPQPDGEFDISFGGLSYWRATAGITFKF
jgi:hypothetical protein